jgi:hypothetical protein
MQKQINMEGVQLREETHKILKAAAKSVHRPGHDYVEFALSGIPNEPIKLWSLIPAFGAAYSVIFVDPDNFTAHPARNFAQLALLIGGRLVNG